MPLSQRDASKSTIKRYRTAPRHLTESARFDFFTAPTDDGSGCILWTGAAKPNGYGTFRDAFGPIQAHRYAYRRANGRESLIAGMDVDHLCHRPACVNPAHLELVTRSENMRRTRRCQRETCANGHPWTDATTVYRKNGGKQCRVCMNDARRRYAGKVKADRPPTHETEIAAVVEASPANARTILARLEHRGLAITYDTLRASLAQAIHKPRPLIRRVARGLYGVVAEAQVTA